MKKKTFIVIGIIVASIILLANYQSIIKSILPPDPVIVSSYADGTSSTLFNYSIKVKGEVRNQGGDGYIIIEAHAFQGDKEWTKTKNVYLESYQSTEFEIVFDEVKLLNADPEYRLETYALGSTNY